MSATEVALRQDEPPKGDLRYRIRRPARETSARSDAFPGSSAGARDAGLEPPTEDAYRSRTLLSAQGYRSGRTELVHATTEAPARRLGTVTRAAAELARSEVAGAVEYAVRRRKPANSGRWTSVDTLAATALTDSEAVAAREYEYRVRAFVRNAPGRTLPTESSDSVAAEAEGLRSGGTPVSLAWGVLTATPVTPLLAPVLHSLAHGARQGRGSVATGREAFPERRRDFLSARIPNNRHGKGKMALTSARETKPGSHLLVTASVIQESS